MEAHAISLVRKPTLGGRIALLTAVLLGIGPGGTYLFRFTQTLFANDAQPVAQTESAEIEESPLPLPSIGWKAVPTWDLTERAKDAWMVVESDEGKAASDSSKSAAGTSPKAAAATLGGSIDEIQLLSQAAQAESAAPQAVRAESETISRTESGSNVVAADIDAERELLIRSRNEWQGLDEEYFHEPVAAPVAPSADSAPLQTVKFPASSSEVSVVESESIPGDVAPEDEATEQPSEVTAAETAPEAPTTSATVSESPEATEQDPMYVDVPGENAAPEMEPLIVHEPMPVVTSEGMPYPVFQTGMCGSGAHPRCGVHCNGDCGRKDLRWADSWLIPWEVFAQGEYIGPSRTPHVPEYRLRVDDQVEFVYRLTGEKSAGPYQISVGDTLRVESLTSDNLNRDAIVQPDGTISLTHLGQVPVAGRSIEEVRTDLEERYAPHVRNPAITVTPIKVNTVLEELRATVDSRFGNGGQSRIARVTPEGTVQLPAIGSVPAHGLTLGELRTEIEYRYAELVAGLEVTPILHERAPRYVYVLGEVRAPGRYTLDGPTTLMQSIALAGGWNVGANLTQVVVFRRDDCWQLMATKIGIKRPLYGKDPCPDGEIWLRDSDIVVVPKSPILVVDEFIDLVFTRGVYGVIPFSTNLSYFRNLTEGAASIVPVMP